MKTFLKNMGIYFFGNVASRLLSLFMLPLFTSKLTTAEYGQVDLTITIISVIAPILFIEIWMGILRYLYDYDNIEDKQKVVSTGFYLSFIALVLFTLLYFLFSLIFKFDYSLLIYFFGVSYLAHSLLSYTVRGLGFNSVYVWSGIIGSVVMIVSNLVLILGFNLKIEAMLFSAALSYLAPVVYMEIKSKALIGFRIKNIDKKLLKNLFFYCLPLSINSVSFWLTTSFNRIVINEKLGLGANGEFGIAFKFSTIIMLIVTVFNLAWQEAAFAMGNDEKRGEKYTRVLKYYNRFIGCGVLLILPATSLMFPILVDKSFYGAKVLLPIYYLATYANTIAGFLGSVICADKKTNALFVSTAVGATISVASLYLLMPIMGLQAATVSIFISFLSMVLIRLFVAKKNNGVSFDYKFFIIFTPLFVLVSYVFLNYSILINVLVSIPVLAICGFILKDLLIMVYKNVSKMMVKK